jgi:hypothetical protein
MKTLTNIGILIVNLIVLGMSLKLYTEIFKDKAISGRVKRPHPQGDGASIQACA